MDFGLTSIRFFSLIFFVLICAISTRTLIQTARAVKQHNTSVMFALMILAISMTICFWMQSNWIDGLQISDAVEYGLTSVHLWCDGRNGFLLNEEFFPGRYSPFFSAVFLAPMQIFSDQCSLELLQGPILLSAFFIMSLSSIFLLRYSPLSALIGVALILLLPNFRYFSVLVMTELPFCFLYLLSFFVLHKVYNAERRISMSLLTLGCIVALACGLRLQNIFLFLPHFFLITKRESRGTTLIFHLPLFCLFALSAWYQLKTFGSPFRTGYHFWLPVPYENFFAVFSSKYFLQNVLHLLEQSSLIPLFLFLTVLISFARRSEKFLSLFRSMNSFFILLAISWCCQILIQLFYFYSSTRFFLPIEIALCIAIAITISFLIPHKQSERGVSIFGSIIMIAMLFLIPVLPKNKAQSELPEIDVLQALQQHANDGSRIFTTYNLAFLQFYLPHSTVLPWGREQMYANQLILPEKKDAFFKVENPLKHRDERLLALGARDIFPK